MNGFVTSVTVDCAHHTTEKNATLRRPARRSRGWVSNRRRSCSRPRWRQACHHKKYVAGPSRRRFLLGSGSGRRGLSAPRRTSRPWVPPIVDSVVVRPAQRSCTMKEAIDALRNNDSRLRHTYLRHASLEAMPALRAALPLSRMVPPSSRLQSRVSGLGTAAASSLHFDGTDNLLLQLFGEKDVLLFLRRGLLGYEPPRAEHGYPFDGERFLAPSVSAVPMLTTSRRRTSSRVVEHCSRRACWFVSLPTHPTGGALHPCAVVARGHLTPDSAAGLERCRQPVVRTRHAQLRRRLHCFIRCRRPTPTAGAQCLRLGAAAAGRLAEAVDAHEAAITAESRCPMLTRSELGLALGSLGSRRVDERRFEEASTLFSQAVRLAPTDSTAYYRLALSLDDNGQHEEAIAAFGAAAQPIIAASPALKARVSGRAGRSYRRERWVESRGRAQASPREWWARRGGGSSSGERGSSPESAVPAAGWRRRR